MQSESLQPSNPLPRQHYLFTSSTPNPCSIFQADVVEILSQATAVFDAMTLLLEEDADMFYMQLTKLQNNPALAESEDFEDHDEVVIHTCGE
jgi:hypothetical protein